LEKKIKNPGRLIKIGRVVLQSLPVHNINNALSTESIIDRAARTSGLFSYSGRPTIETYLRSATR